jgi:hypothetical protein
MSSKKDGGMMKAPLVKNRITHNRSIICTCGFTTKGEERKANLTFKLHLKVCKEKKI